MSFLFPLGLLGLIGIPILIIIYIIKNKHAEQTVSSNYLWHLSEKFIKRRRPIPKIQGILSLILQILIVTIVSLLIAHPVLSFKNAARDYCFVLDSSGSMSALYDGKDTTRFDSAKKEVKDIIKKSWKGSTYTIIVGTNEPYVLVEGETSKDAAIKVVNELIVSDTVIDMNATAVLANKFFSENRSMDVRLFTDEAPANTNNIKVYDYSSDAYNVALLDLDYQVVGVTDDFNNTTLKTRVIFNVISYNQDCEVKYEVFADGLSLGTTDISLEKDTSESVIYFIDEVDYSQIEVNIIADDNIKHDNSITKYNLAKETDFKTMIVSNDGFYLKSAIEALRISSVEIVKPEEYSSSVSGYGLYIYDNVTPATLPMDGAVWLFKPSVSIAEAGYSYSDIVNIDKDNVIREGVIQYQNSTNSTYRLLTSGIYIDEYSENKICAQSYVKLSLYKKFTTLMHIDNNPAVAVGVNDYNNRIVLFSFCVNESNITLKSDFVILLKNLLNYSFPRVINENFYTTGDSMNINILANIKSIRIDTPSGNSKYLPIVGTNATYKLNEAGNYKVTVTTNDNIKTYNVFSKFPDDEGTLELTNYDFVVSGDKQTNYNDGLYNSLIVLFILLAAIYVVDWMVYCYEQYQLQ